MATQNTAGGGTGCGAVDVLPEGCIARVLSFTSPPDACRMSLVSPLFRSAAESNAVWESFLPPDYQTIISQSVTSSSASVGFSSKKELYFSLCDNPISIDEGRKSFALEKWSGKKCYMLSARDLVIVWGSTPTYWRWTSLPEARFTEVAELLSVCWLEMRGKINTHMLSQATLYAAYLVFKSTTGAYGFDHQPVEVAVGLVGTESCKQPVYLCSEGGQRRQSHFARRRIGLFNRGRILGPQASMPRQSNAQCPKERGDGWLEIELGEFFNDRGDDGELEMSVTEVKGGHWKGGLIVQGIEIRPKERK